MAKEKKPGVIERERKIKEAIGVTPVFAAAAAYEGAPRITRHLRYDIPAGLHDFVTKGQRLPEKAMGGRPLQQIAEFTRAEVKAIQRFASDSGVKIPIVSGSDHAMWKAKSGYFSADEMPSQKVTRAVSRALGKKTPPLTPPHIALSSKSLPMAFHEIGHASPAAGSHRARRVLQDIGGHLGAGGTPGAFARLLLAGNVLAPPDEDSSAARRFAYDHAPGIVGATFVPQLAEELRASGKAVRGIRRQGLGTLKAIKELLPAFGTYAGAAAGPVIATMLAKNLIRILHEKGGEEKQATAKPGAEVKAPGLLRTGAASAWHIGGRTPPKPKSIKPNSDLDATARGRTQAKPPSNRMYHKDMLASLYNPQRGFRLATPG